jgi:hypothetical protein
MIKGGLTLILVYLCALVVLIGSSPAARTANTAGNRKTFIVLERATLRISLTGFEIEPSGSVGSFYISLVRSRSFPTNPPTSSARGRTGSQRGT